MAITTPEIHRNTQTFRHEALFYDGPADFVDKTAPFIRQGVAANEAILVVVSAAKIERLRAALGRDAGRVRFADMDDVGLNPARIIPAWRDFVTEHADDGRPFRGIGEPIWSERSPDELVECQRHESLLNVAFDGSPAWWLLCPYDARSLDPAVLEEAGRSHPHLMHGEARLSPSYLSLEASAAPFDAPLPEPPISPKELEIGPGTLDNLRRFVARHAAEGLLSAARNADLVLAVNELATNSLRHGGGRGLLRAWVQGDVVICEVQDSGRIEEPLAGRERPVNGQENGFGLWLVNQLCDLVQMRTYETGTVVRLHMSRG
jgi:anti-sigma regulatory factor (Ser/Thr protein kinase)